MVVGVSSLLLLSTVDAWFIGRLGSAELAALSYTFPVIGLVMNLSIGLSIGVTAAVARAIGSGHEDRMRRLTTDALLLSLGLVAVTAVVGMLTIGPVFRLMRADDAQIALIREYMLIFYPSMALLVVPMIGNSALRAAGDSSTQAYTMVLAAVLNALLDPLLIFGWGPIPALGLAGAAWATVPSRAVAMVITFQVLFRRERMIALERVPLRQIGESWVEILRVGLPATATNIVPPVAAGMLTGLVAGYGAEAVAAYGAGTRVEMLALVVPMALTAAVSPLVGQNWGAGRLDRVAQTARLGERIGLGWGLVVWALLALGAEAVASQFAREPGVVQPLASYLTYGAAGMGFAAVTLSAASVFNAVGQPLRATALALVRTAVLALPLAWLGSTLGGLRGLFLGIAAANVLTGVMSALWSRGLKTPHDLPGGTLHTAGGPP